MIKDAPSRTARNQTSILEPVQCISLQARNKPNPISNTSRTSTIYQSSSSFPFWNIESMHAVSKFYGQVIPKN